MRVCPKCAELNDADAERCEECNAWLVPRPQPATKPKRPRWLERVVEDKNETK